MPKAHHPSIVLTFRQVNVNDIPSIHEIEISSYPEDEAASLSSIEFRANNAPQYFLVATTTKTDKISNIEEQIIVGYINGTKCKEFTHEAMSGYHDLNGRYLAIHSVVTREDSRKQGYGTAMLIEYIQRIQKNTLEEDDKYLQKIVLLSKSHNLPLYINVGFQVIGKSDIVHGHDIWYDCQLQLEVKQQSADKKLDCFVVDAFAFPNQLFNNNDTTNKKTIIHTTTNKRSGNPAAVVIMNGYYNNVNDGNHDNEMWKKEISKEFNLSETAFLWKHGGSKDDGDNSYSWDIRYYTNTGVEVDLCGHATLASAAVLASISTTATQDTFTFYTNKSVICATLVSPQSSQYQNSNDESIQEGNHDVEEGIWIRMDLPWNTLTPFPKKDPNYPHIISMLSISLQIQESDVLYIGTSQSHEDIHVEISSSKFHTMKSEGIDYNAMSLDTLPYKRGICISCCNNNHDKNDNNSTIDFFSRFFGPKVGILEDPVTGSAHAYLGPYYSTMLQKNKVRGKQVSNRGGILYCTLQQEKNVVSLHGFARIFMKGCLE